MKPETKTTLVISAAVAIVAVTALTPQSDKDLTVFDGCPMLGSAKPGSIEAEENPLKNRFTAPTEIDPSITLETLMAAKVGDNPDQSKGASIRGWVVFVKPGGKESVNCESSVDLDTHILISPTQGGDKHHVLIVEVTPRMRYLHPDWSQVALKSSLTGHLVKFTGFILDDEEHKVSSFVDNPSGRSDWRASCWEIHPITGIQILK